MNCNNYAASHVANYDFQTNRSFTGGQNCSDSTLKDVLYQPINDLSNKCPSNKYQRLIAHLPSDVLESLKLYTTTRAKLERYVTHLTSDRMGTFFHRHSLDKVSRVSIAAFLENLITFNELATIHQNIASYDTLILNPKAHVTLMDSDANRKDLAWEIKSDVKKPEIFRRHYTEYPDELQKYLHLSDEEWKSFCQLMSHESQSEQHYTFFLLPQAGSFAPLYDRLLHLINCFHPSYVTFKDGDSQVKGLKCLIIASFSMYQHLFDVKAKTEGRKTVKLCPTFHELSVKDLWSMKRKRKMPAGLYCPVPRYYGKKYSKEIKKKVFSILDNVTKKFMENFDGNPGNPLIFFKHDLYHAIRELGISDGDNIMRNQLIEWIDQLASAADENVKSHCTNLTTRLIDGELISSFVSPFALYGGGKVEQNGYDRFLKDSRFYWHPMIKQFIKQQIYPGYLPKEERIRLRKQISFDKSLFHQLMQNVSPAYRPFRATQFALEFWQPFVYRCPQSSPHEKLNKAERQTSCVVTLAVLAAIFLGAERSREVISRFEYSLRFNQIIYLPSERQFNFECLELFSGYLLSFFKKNIPEKENTKTYRKSNCDQLNELSFLGQYSKFLNEKITQWQSIEITPEESDAKTIRNIERGLSKLEFDFNKETLKSLMADFHDTAKKTTHLQSHVYFIGISKPTSHRDGSPKADKSNFFHQLTIEQYKADDGSVKHRIYDSWHQVRTLKESLSARGLGEADQGALNTDEMTIFLNDLGQFLDPVNDQVNRRELALKLFNFRPNNDIPPVNYYDPVARILKCFSLRYDHHAFNPASVEANLIELAS